MTTDILESQFTRESLTTNNGTQNQSLRECVQNALKNYFDRLDGHTPADIHRMVLSEIEDPMLREVMHYTKGNQTKAAVVLGISRGTLRKMLKEYDLL